MPAQFGKSKARKDGIEALKPDDVVFLCARNFSAYATGIEVEENWVKMRYLAWVPCETGETMSWRDAQAMRDEISAFRMASREEADLTIKNVPQLRYLGKFVVVDDGHRYFGRLSKAYRDGIELAPHIHLDCDGPRIEERPFYLSLDMSKPGVAIEEISEEEFRRVQAAEKEEWEERRKGRQAEKK